MVEQTAHVDTESRVFQLQSLLTLSTVHDITLQRFCDNNEKHPFTCFFERASRGSDPLWHIDKFIYFDCLSDLDQVLQIDIINDLVFIHPLV